MRNLHVRREREREIERETVRERDKEWGRERESLGESYNTQRIHIRRVYFPSAKLFFKHCVPYLHIQEQVYIISHEHTNTRQTYGTIRMKEQLLKRLTLPDG